MLLDTALQNLPSVLRILVVAVPVLVGRLSLISLFPVPSLQMLASPSNNSPLLPIETPGPPALKPADHAL
jgi:hypothetical protein